MKLIVDGKLSGMSLLVMIIAGVLTVGGGQPQYQVQIQPPLRFTYRSGRQNQVADGSCCVATEIPPCTLPCTGIRVDVCFREQQHPSVSDDMDFNNCPLGGMTFTPTLTSTFSSTGSITFQPSVNATTTVYLGSLQFLFRVRAVHDQQDSLIDSGFRTISHPITDKADPTFRVVFGSGKNSIARVIVNRLALTCKEGYVGSNCGVKECVPRNDTAGHFTCDISQNKVCLPGYQNPETNCVEQATPNTEATTSTGLLATTTTALPAATSTGATTTELPKASTIQEPVTESTVGGLVTTVEPGDTMDLERAPASTTEPDVVRMVVSPTSFRLDIVAGGSAGAGLVLLLLFICSIVLIMAVIIKLKKNRRAKSKAEWPAEGPDATITMETYPINNNRADNTAAQDHPITMEINTAYNSDVNDDIDITMETNEDTAVHVKDTDPESYYEIMEWK